MSGNNFNPSLAGVGTSIIIYSYTDANGCTGIATNTISVVAGPVVSFSGPLASQCADNAPFALTGGLPAGGNYSGEGVTAGGIFNPAVLGPGTWPISYSYSNGACVATANTTITVTAPPVVSFGGTLAPQCVSNTARMYKTAMRRPRFYLPKINESLAICHGNFYLQ